MVPNTNKPTCLPVTSALDSAEVRHVSRVTGKQLAALVAVVLLFAAGMLQFARLQWQHAPADQRVNNGEQPTFFAFHISPYYNFSEDFHLYYVRAKRIAERGWTDSLLHSSPEAKPNYVAPVQVAVSSLAVATDGHPVWYSLFMFGVLGVAWSALVVAARYWLPRNVAGASILLAVLVTVLFEAAEFIIKGGPTLPSAGQWPMFRCLRFATMGWTSPLLVVAMLGCVSLVFDRRYWHLTIGALGLVLALLAGADNWAFALAWCAAVATAGYLGVALSLQRWRNGYWPYAARRTFWSLSAMVLAMYGLHAWLAQSLTGDAMLRSGIGQPWSRATNNYHWREIHQILLWNALPQLFVVLFFAVIEVRPRRPGHWFPVRWAPRSFDATWCQLCVLALLPLASMLLLFLALTIKGLEPFLRMQVLWRVDYCWLFVVVLAIAESIRLALPAWPLKFCRWPTAWPAAVAVLLVVLLAFHNYRLHRFVTGTAGRECFLLADHEKLRPWLEQFDQEHSHYQLATASVELNFLAAYWTNADLLLPSGFPYHNAASNDSLRKQAIDFLRVFNVTEEKWLDITKYPRIRFQDLWLKSRSQASFEGYVYHFYHRMYDFYPMGQVRWREKERLLIGKNLREPDANNSQPRPELILIDEVSRKLGQPDLTGYTREYNSGTVEAWVRNDVLLTDRQRAAKASVLR